MKKILIVGSGDFGREIYGWISGDSRHGVEWEVAGFLDDNANALSRYSHYPIGITGRISDYQPNGELLVFGIAAPKTRLMLGEKLLAKGAEFLTYIHPTAIVSQFTTIGRGCFFAPYAMISNDVRIGDFVAVNCAASVAHDCSVGDGCMINSHCDLTGHTQFGKGVYFGTSVCVVPKVKVGDFATLGAGSTVTRNVKEGTTVMGPTAQRLSFLEAEAA